MGVVGVGSCISRHTESEFPDQGSNPCPLKWKRGVLTTGPLGNPLKLYTSKDDFSYVLYNLTLCILCLIKLCIFKLFEAIRHSLLLFKEGTHKVCSGASCFYPILGQPTLTTQFRKLLLIS